MTQQNKYAIIVAGGVGSRSGDSLPKQFHDILGHPMLWWSLRAFHSEDPDTRLIVVMHPSYMEYWKGIAGPKCAPHQTVAGGDTRTASVAAGLSLIPKAELGLVAVHDAARPWQMCVCCATDGIALHNTGRRFPLYPCQTPCGAVLRRRARAWTGRSSLSCRLRRFLTSRF